MVPTKFAYLVLSKFRGTKPSKLQPPYDVIFGAELIYDEEVVGPLVKSLELLSNENTLILFSFDTHRDNEETVELLYNKLSASFTFSKIELKDLHPVYQSEAITVLSIKKIL